MSSFPVVPSAPSRALNPEIAQRVHAIHESGEAKRREGALLPPGINWETWDFLLDLAVEHVGGVDSGGVAPAGPWVVERFYTQDKWFVRRGIEIPGEMSQFALRWFRSEAEAEAVCDVLNRVAAPRPAYPGNAVGGEALPKP